MPEIQLHAAIKINVIFYAKKENFPHNNYVDEQRSGITLWLLAEEIQIVSGWDLIGRRTCSYLFQDKYVKSKELKVPMTHKALFTQKLSKHNTNGETL